MSLPLHHEPSPLAAGADRVITYRVQVGHATTTVRGRSVEEAIREARRALCQDMPRMWDAIHKLDDGCFAVMEIG
jgi:hypothetical protein